MDLNLSHLVAFEGEEPAADVVQRWVRVWASQKCTPAGVNPQGVYQVLKVGRVRAV